MGILYQTSSPQSSGIYAEEKAEKLLDPEGW